MKHHPFRSRWIGPAAAILLTVATVAPSPASAQQKATTEETLEDLLSIDVSVASKKKETLSNTPAIVTSIKMDDVRSFGITSLRDALGLVPGVVVQDTPLGGVSVMIRGLSESFNQKVLFLLDGVPYWMPSHGDFPLLSMPAVLIDRIEIIRGPGSVIYGTNASAGVINVVLKKEATRTALALNGGSQGLLNAGAAYSKQMKDGYVYVGGGNQSMSKGYDAFFPKTNLVPPFNTGQQIVNGATVPFPTSGTMVKKEESSDVVAGAKFRGLNFLGHAFTQTGNGLGGSPVIFQTNRLIYRGLLLHADYARSFGNFDLSVYADHNPFALQIDIDNFVASKNAANIVTAAPGKQDYEDALRNNFRTRAGATGTYKLARTASIMFGLENETRHTGDYEKADAADVRLALQSHRMSVNEASAFGQADWAIGRFRMVLGGRFVNNGLAGSHLSPRAAFIYNLDASQAVKVLFSEGFNSPNNSQQELFIPFVVAGNPNLKAEIIRSFDVAYTYSTSAQVFTINYYHLTTKDVIGRVLLPGAAQVQYMNVAGFARDGAEIDFQRSWNRLLFLSNAAYNHQGDRTLAGDTFAKFVPRVTVSGGARYRITNTHSLGLSERFWSARGTLDAQNITNATYIVTHHALEFSFNVQNIFDKVIQNPDVNGNAIPAVPGGPGRSFYVGVRFTR